MSQPDDTNVQMTVHEMTSTTQNEDHEPASFSKLPIELRLEIWAYTIPETRNVEIRWDEQKLQYFTSAILDQAIFQICQESRNFALSKYTLLEFANDVNIHKREDLKEHIHHDAVEPEGVETEDVVEELGSEDLISLDDWESPDAAMGWYSSGMTAAADNQTDNTGTSKKEVETKKQTPLPMFRTWIDFSRDILYFNPAHLGCREVRKWPFMPEAPSPYAFLRILARMPDISTKVRVIAFERDVTEPFFLGTSLCKLPNLENIILIEDDYCCYGIRGGSEVDHEGKCRHLRRKPVFLEPGHPDLQGSKQSMRHDFYERTVLWFKDRLRSGFESFAAVGLVDQALGSNLEDVSATYRILKAPPNEEGWLTTPTTTNSGWGS